MPIDARAKDLVIAVIGTGTMGRGIVQVSAQGGSPLGPMHVIAYDEKPGAAQAAKDYITKTLNGLAEKGRITPEAAHETLARITVTDKLEDIAKAHIVVEAIIERIDIKQDLFAKLDAMCGPDVILASNTSSLAVTAIAAKCKRPERVAGLHFFNPVPLMKLVEVIGGLKTEAWVTDALMILGQRMTREPVLCIDSPGFIVNHAGRAMAEAPRLRVDNIASHEEIDRILTGAPGFKLGPFALADMVGMDVGFAVMESFFQQYYSEPAYAPNPLTALRFAGGLYGQKTGRGWYDYKDGKRVETPLPPVPPKSSTPIWLKPSPHHPELQEPLFKILQSSGVRIETGKSPSADAITLLTPIGYDLTTAIQDLKLDGARTLAVDVLFGMKGPRTLMTTPATDPTARDAVHAALASDGQAVIVINDSPGFVAQRLVAMIVNVGCTIAQRAIASPADIDKAVKLGLGYPHGPLEWGDLIGPKRILHILECLETFYGDPRFRPSPWLKRRVMLDLPLSAPEVRG
jgi:3-hydroxybutyryl-CoA dehydrogenase